MLNNLFQNEDVSELSFYSPNSAIKML